MNDLRHQSAITIQYGLLEKGFPTSETTSISDWWVYHEEIKVQPINAVKT